MNTATTRDNMPIKENQRYYLIVTAQTHPIEVTCVKIRNGHIIVKEYDEDAPAWFPQETIEARECDLFYDYKKAKLANENSFAHAVNHYRSNIKNIDNLIQFPTKVDITKNEAAKNAYLNAAKELFANNRWSRNETMFDSHDMQTLADKSAKTFNPDTQDLILIEKMSELAKALLKHRRVVSTKSPSDETFSDTLKETNDKIVEELTHVFVSCEVLRQTFGIDADAIGEKVAKKLHKYRNIFALTD